MDISSEEKTAWASGLANRLRVLQANWADDDPGTRQESIKEEIERVLEEVSPEKRLLYLNALAEEFPEWKGASAQPLPPPTAPPSAEEKAPLSPQDLVKELAAQAPKLSEAVRLQCAKTLYEAGFKLAQAKMAKVAKVAKGDERASEKMPEELRRRLRLPLGKEINTRAAVKMATHLLGVMLTLDQLGWNMWKTMAPRSRIRRAISDKGDLRNLAGHYLTGDPNVSLAEVAEPLEQTRQLIAGLMGAIGPVGRNYSRRNAAKYSPPSIQDLVRMEPGKIWDSLDVKCWRKYKELAKDLTEESIEKQLHEAIVQFAEELMGSSDRASKGSTS